MLFDGTNGRVRSFLQVRNKQNHPGGKREEGPIDRQAEWLKKAREGDVDAFAELCAPFSQMLYRHCLHMLGQEADAQDAAQEALLRAFRAMPRFMGQSGVATWLYRIAHNACLDMLKRPQRKRENVSVEQLREGGFEPEAAGDDPEAAYVKTEAAQRVQAAIRKLPREQQLLLDLRYGEGLSYEELARVTGIREGTVKSKLSRAKDRLQELLQENVE